MADATFTRRTALVGLAALAACSRTSAEPRAASPKAAQLLDAARAQIGVTRSYDPAYTRLAYPGGDVPRAKGVCTDVVVRAYRDAFDIDLQALVHSDMAKAFRAYPQNWGLRRPDSNIDHRRVPNLATFFRRKGAELRLPADAADWQAGDVFAARLLNGLVHTGIVSNQRSALGGLMVIHNWGSGTQEEAVWPMLRPYGRFRFML